MARETRLFVDAGLAKDATVALSKAQAHRLANVLRMSAGDEVTLFNGRDGEWRAGLTRLAKSSGEAQAIAETRPQAPEPGPWLVFAGLKRGPVDLIAEKATELGASALVPVVTRHTAVTRVNTERLRAIAVEAAEQCRRLTVPEVFEPAPLDDVLASWREDRRLLVLDEAGGGRPIAEALHGQSAPVDDAILIGPEGGFARSELDALRNLDFVTPVSLGDRILRAETAAIAALACWQALAGDWRGGSD